MDPELLNIESTKFKSSVNKTDKARLDISARGLWSPFQNTMFDVRIFHPNAASYKDKDMSKLYAEQ